jgi:hydrogenase maturation protease
VTEPDRRAVVVIGVGNEFRHDDGVGIEVARRMLCEIGGEPIDVKQIQEGPIVLLDAWHGRPAAVVVDTMRSGAGPGTIRRFDASHDPLPSREGASSTHAVGVGEAIELARTLGQLPARLIVYAVEGRRFDAGLGLSAGVVAILPVLTAMVLDEARAMVT